MLEKLSPVLPSRDIDRTEAFYAGIGFRTVHRDGASYLLMKRDMAEVHFVLSETHDPQASPHGAFLRPDDIDALSAELSALGLPADDGLPRFRPAEDMPWGMREATLWDPDGNQIRAAQEIANWPR